MNITEAQREDERKNPTLLIFCTSCGEYFFARMSDDPRVVATRHAIDCLDDGDYLPPKEINGLPVDVFARGGNIDRRYQR